MRKPKLQMKHGTYSASFRYSIEQIKLVAKLVRPMSHEASHEAAFPRSFPRFIFVITEFPGGSQNIAHLRRKKAKFAPGFDAAKREKLRPFATEIVSAHRG
jgi:hypothetical protein